MISFLKSFAPPSILLLISAGLAISYSCDTKLEQSAKPTPEICNRYQDIDKKNWCLGKCDQVQRDDYRQLCLVTLDKRGKVDFSH